jgi:hypothetical protein
LFQKKRLKRDRLVFFLRASGKLTGDGKIKMRSLERTPWLAGSRLLPLGFSLLPSDFKLLSSGKYYFLPNEPKLIQCLPRFLKNKVLTNRIRTDQNRIKTPLNRVKTPSKPLNSPLKTPCPP